MRDKVVLITGATSGIGKETAKQLAKLGATVVITARDSIKGDQAVSEIVNSSSNRNVSFLTADLSSQQEIRKLSRDFREKFDRLDVLVNNAGVYFTNLTYSVDEVEMQFASNHLSPFLLTGLLLDLIKKSAPSRIVNVSSDAGLKGKINFEDVYFSKNYNGTQAYRQSKLANILFTYELARRLKETGVTVNCLNPGGVNTKLGEAHSHGFIYWAWRMAKPFFLSVEEGAQTSVYLASSSDVENVTGKYFEKKMPVKTSELSYDAHLAERLWKLSERMVGYEVGPVH